MKNKIFVSVFILFFMVTTSSFAQFNPYSENTKMVTVGIGASFYGIPVYLRYEQPIIDNVSIGGSLSYQSRTRYDGYYDWKHTNVGIVGRGSYHFNELLNATDEWDFYAGVSLGYYFENHKYDGIGNPIYRGSGYGGFDIGPHVGARYFVTDNIGLNAEMVASSNYGGTIGVTFLF